MLLLQDHFQFPCMVWGYHVYKDTLGKVTDSVNGSWEQHWYKYIPQSPL